MLTAGSTIKTASGRYVVEVLSRGKYAVLTDLSKQRQVLVRPDHLKKKGPKGELSLHIFGKLSTPNGVYTAALESSTGSKDLPAHGINLAAFLREGRKAIVSHSMSGKSASIDTLLAAYPRARQLPRYMMKGYFERNLLATSGWISRAKDINLPDPTEFDAMLCRQRAARQEAKWGRTYTPYTDEAGVKLLASLFGLRTLNIVLGPIRIHHRPSPLVEGHMSTTVFDRATLQVLWRRSGDCRG